MNQLLFTIPEILSLIGVAQCLYIIVYIAFRAGRISRAGLPLLYFFILGLAFLSDFAYGYISELWNYYEHAQWFAWFYVPPISVLLIIQIARITRVPAIHHYWILFLIPVAYFISLSISQSYEDLQDWLTISGLVAGVLSMLVIWGNRGLFESILTQKIGKERYWLIIALIFMNIFFLGGMFAALSYESINQNIILLRTLFGLGFVYLVSTSLFRIYPQAVEISEKSGANNLSFEEMDIAFKIERLLAFDKVYQEASYSRTDLARECDISESVLSRIINAYFKQSFPQLMNEYRVIDATQLLLETNASISVIANDVGFNSLASFNRVFKDIVGKTPSSYRKSK
ncbi:MAG: helix-turn-helix transcriptional regulator [Alphaproteobacteria bacterium]|nr:helix-turn-helix transcriptional regulator [Alphaproteobacteria bacterium]